MGSTRVGIIGGGWSGIYTAKHCLEEGLEPTVFEAAKDIGGQWRYHPDEGGGVRHNTETVSSKVYMSPTDFPYPEEAPEFLQASTVYQHFLDYVDHFNLRSHIQCDHQVIKAYKDKAEWVVVTNQGEYRFDKLVVATGTNKVPYIPNDPMYQNFEGRIHHSHNLVEMDDSFDGKRVLVVGGSDTASDIACELSHKAEVTVSIRSGTWFQDKVVDDILPELKGYPADMAYSRLVDKLLKATDYKVLKYQGFIRMVEEYWGVCGSDVPEWFTPAGYLNTYYTKSRSLVHKTREGEITPQKGIKRIHGHHVYFHGDDAPHYFDDIIFCTGYRANLDFEFPFTPTEQRYRKVLCVDDPSVAFIGYIRPYLTSIVMLAEMQSRWVAHFFANEKALPDPQTMQKLIKEDEAARAHRFPMYYQRMPFLVDPYMYQDGLARDIGQYPNYLMLLFTNPSLAYHIFLDSWNPFAYRVHDKDPEKRRIAIEEIEKLKEHPISVKIRNALYYGITGLFSNIWSAASYFTKRVPKSTESVEPVTSSHETVEAIEPIGEAKPLLYRFAKERDTTRAQSSEQTEETLALRQRSGYALTQ